MPVPVSDAVRGMVEALVVSESVPGRVPVWVGLNLIWRVQLEFAGIGEPMGGQVPACV